MLKKFLPIVLLLVLVNIAVADSLKTEVVNDQISPYDSAAYRITILNDKNVSDKYVIEAKDIGWAVQTEPLTDYTTGITIAPHSEYTTILLAKPREQRPFIFGPRSFQVDFRSEQSGDVLSAVLGADIRQDLIKSPLNIDTTFVMSDVISPLKPNSIKIIVKNNNLLNISNLSIYLKSNFFEKTASVNLLPEEEKVFDFSVELDPGTAPQKDTAVLQISWQNKDVKTIKKDYAIGAYGKFKSESSVQRAFLKKITTVEYTNEGNAQQTESILIETTPFERLFTSTSPKTTVTKVNNIPYYTAELTLGPNESATVIAKTSYISILYICIIILALLILYFLFRTPVIAAKEAKDVVVEEGGIRAVSVTIKVKNRSSSPVHSVRVIDRIPNITIAEIRKADALSPDKTFHYTEGIVLQYSLNKMEPGEIRFITYHLKTKLGVVGDLRLKPVIVQYEGGKKTYSNAVDVYSP